jgi:hypothetical protein
LSFVLLLSIALPQLRPDVESGRLWQCGGKTPYFASTDYSRLHNMTKAGLPTRISTPRFAFPKNQWHNETKLLRYGDEFARDFHPTSLFTESAKHPRHRQSSHF